MILRFRPACAFLLLIVAAPGESSAVQRAAYEELQTFSAVLNHIRLNHADTVTYAHMVKAAIVGVLRSLDPHSYYLSRADWERRSALERGELATIGLTLVTAGGAATVLAVARGGPADRRGVLPGDRVVAVDDTTVAGMTAEEVALRLAGDDGVRVRVRVERGPRLAPDTVTVTVKREFEKSSTVGPALMIAPATGYVRLSGFEQSSSRDLAKAIERLESAGASRLVLDLRGNPGGSVVSAVEVASLFLPRGALVFRTVGRKSDANEEYVTGRAGPFRDLPLMILIDRHSASAAEALSGCLQDQDRALVLGRTSFGKALMQSVFLLPDGDVVWLTVGRVITPSGRSIQRPFRGLGVEQYRSLAGTGSDPADTIVYRTTAGRLMRGGGGIVPDVELPRRPDPPTWWTAAVDSGYGVAVADSVAHTLLANAAGRDDWLAARDAWEAMLVAPFLQRVREGLGLDVRPEAELRATIARRLAVRVAAVRWGPEAADRFGVATDLDVRTATAHFERLPALLASPTN